MLILSRLKLGNLILFGKPLPTCFPLRMNSVESAYLRSDHHLGTGPKSILQFDPP
jgi:hypothetical protein